MKGQDVVVMLLGHLKWNLVVCVTLDPQVFHRACELLVSDALEAGLHCTLANGFGTYVAQELVGLEPPL